MQNHKSFTTASYSKAYPHIGRVIEQLKLNEIVLVSLQTTTFLNQKSSGITEIALLKVLKKGDAYSISTLINPENSISVYVSNLSGITQEQVQNHYNWPTFLKKSGHRWMKYVLTGFSVDKYDIPYIEQQNNRYTIHYTISNKTLDIKALCEHFHPENKGSLAHFCNLYGIDGQVRHRAQPDNSLIAKLFEAVIEKQGDAAVVACLQTSFLH